MTTRFEPSQYKTQIGAIPFNLPATVKPAPKRYSDWNENDLRKAMMAEPIASRVIRHPSISKYAPPKKQAPAKISAHSQCPVMRAAWLALVDAEVLAQLQTYKAGVRAVSISDALKRNAATVVRSLRGHMERGMVAVEVVNLSGGGRAKLYRLVKGGTQ